MLKRILCLVLCVIAVGCLFAACGGTEDPAGSEEPEYTGPHRFLVTDQKSRQIRLYDLRDSDWSKPEWFWTCEEKTFTNVDGVKYRYHEPTKTDVIAFCSSGGYVGVISYPLGELLYYIRNAGGNPHSVEILPDGSLALAASHGNYVRIYDTSEFGDISDRYTQVTVESAHGVLWDPEEEVLWALGMDFLHAFEVSEDHEMLERDDLRMLLPSPSGHDLAPVYGNPDRMWVTVGGNVYQVSKSEGKVLQRYDGWASISATAAVKGIGNFEDGTLIYAQANGTQQAHNTNLVTVGRYDAEQDRYFFEQREIPGSAYYKLRIFSKDYN